MSNLGDNIQNAIDEFNDLTTGGDWRSTQEDTFLPALKGALDDAVAEDGHDERVRDTVAGFLAAAGSVSLDHDDANDTLTVSADENTDTQLSPEQVQDIVGAFVSGAGATSVSYDDAGNSLVIDSTDTNTQLSTQDVIDAVGGSDINPSTIGDNTPTQTLNTEQASIETLSVGGSSIAEWELLEEIDDQNASTGLVLHNDAFTNYDIVRIIANIQNTDDLNRAVHLQFNDVSSNNYDYVNTIDGTTTTDDSQGRATVIGPYESISVSVLVHATSQTGNPIKCSWRSSVTGGGISNPEFSGVLTKQFDNISSMRFTAMGSVRGKAAMYGLNPAE